MRAGVLYEAIEKCQGSELTMNVAVLELLSDGACGLGWTGVLEVDNLDEIWNATKVILRNRLACQPLYRNGDCRVRLLLRRFSA